MWPGYCRRFRRRMQATGGAQAQRTPAHIVMTSMPHRQPAPGKTVGGSDTMHVEVSAVQEIRDDFWGMHSMSDPLYHRIYEVVRHIPPGRVATYGQVASVLGTPVTAREVGDALAALRQEQADPP